MVILAPEAYLSVWQGRPRNVRLAALNLEEISVMDLGGLGPGSVIQRISGFT